MTKNDCREFYRVEAEGYETTRYGSSYGGLFRLLQRAAVARALALSLHPARILDVATGTGQMLSVLASRDALVAASDITPALLAEARRLHRGEQGVVFCVGDAMQLPYADGSFDVVASSRFLHLFEAEKQQLLLREMTRVLRPDGMLVVDFYSAEARRALWLPIVLYRRNRVIRAEDSLAI